MSAASVAAADRATRTTTGLAAERESTAPVARAGWSFRPTAHGRVRTRPTRHGWAVALLGVLVAAAAANTGANLLFLVLGLLIGTVAVSWWYSRRVLRAAALVVELPELVEAGRPFPAQVEVEGAGGPLVLRARGLLPDQGVCVGVGSNAFTARALRRGIITSVRLEVTSSWPLHLWQRSLHLDLEVGLPVHPAIARYRETHARRGREGDEDAPEAGRGGSLRDLREYLPGDSPRRIHWPSTARQGRLVVREDHAESRRRVTLDLPTEVAGRTLEHALSRIAGRLLAAINEGAEVRLVGPRCDLLLAGPRGLTRGLRLLAGYGIGPDAARSGQ